MTAATGAGGRGGALLVAGTTSDAGKSLLTTGICRWLYRQGVRVAPFKAQNMSNNSAVTADGGEIGRAQALQAAACGLEPSVRFNPVLLKPGSDRSSQLVVLGQAVGTVSAASYRDEKHRLLEVVLDTLAGLRAEFDAVICEGAGSPAEINLRATDVANMGLARAAELPVVVVADIDRGGAFAALFGTLALLSPEDQALISGFVINKFRGDRELLAPGLGMIEQLTGRPVLGAVPWIDGLGLDAEDSLSYPDGGLLGRGLPPVGSEWLHVAVPRLPRVSNLTDLDAFAAEPGVQVRLVRSASGVADADLVVIPGSKATVADLGWLRDSGLADAILAHHAAGRPVLGICGGYQMLAESITDEVESGAGTVAGLGLAPLRVAFAAEKTLARPHGTVYGGVRVSGYEIHHGRITHRAAGVPEFVTLADGGGEGVRWHVDGNGAAGRGAVFGTHWHGAFECDEFRRGFLTEVGGLAGRHGFVVAPDTSYAATRAAALDRMADVVDAELDTFALRRLLEAGAPAGLPFLPPGAP